MEKKQDAIFASRDNIPELSQYKMMQELERHKVDVANDIKNFSRPEKIQLRSRKQFTLTTAKTFNFLFRSIASRNRKKPTSLRP
jgi:hypothetical protein